MFNFSGCKCPVCQQPLTEKDDIVVCPECGAPYHRNCYQEHGSCVFANRHGIDFEWKPAPGEAAKADSTAASTAESSTAGSTQEIPCPRCGAMNPSNDLFCESCGAPLQKGAPSYSSGTDARGAASYGPGSVPPNDPFHIAGLPPEAQVHPDEVFEGISARDWAAYLGDNAAWYLLNFKQMHLSGRKTAISFSAFLFGPYYFLYRKMWAPAIGLFVTALVLAIPTFMEMMLALEMPIAASFSPQLISILVAVCSTLSLIIKFACGGFAVNLYKKLSARKIHKILENGPVDAAVLKKAGGTSKLALIICLGGAFIVSWLLVIFAATPTIMGGISL